MATTGEVFPTTATTVAETPWLDNDWTSAGSVTADDGTTANVTAASFDSPDQTFVLKAQGFDFSAIPDGSTINGVTARVNAWFRSGQGSGSLDLCQLLDTSSAKVGTNQCSTPVALTTTTSTVVTKGSSSDLWGNALDAAWVKNANFGIALGILATAANADVDIDYVTLEIDYTAPAGNDFTRTVDDAEGLSDSGLARNVNPVGTEPLDLTDSVTTQLFTEHTRTPADDLGVTDTAAVVSDFARVQTDPLGLTDSTTVDLTSGGTNFTRTIDDTLGLADADQSQQLDVAETLDDPLGLTDTVDVQASGAPTRQVDDSLGLTDAAAQATVYIRTVDDPLGLADTATPQLAGAGTRQVDDTLSLTDTVTQATPYIRSQSDSLGLTDAVTPQLTRAVSDNLGLTDTRAEDVGKNPADVLGLTDSISVVLSWVRTVDDLLALTDVAMGPPPPGGSMYHAVRPSPAAAGTARATSAASASTRPVPIMAGR